MTNLPEGWAPAKLEELVEAPRDAIVDGPFGSNLKTSDYVGSGVPVVRIQNVYSHQFIKEGLIHISAAKALELRRHSFVAGDIVVTKLGEPLGRACVVPPSVPTGVIVADVVRVRIAEPILRDFVCLAINSPTGQAQLNENTKGTTRPRVNLGQVRSLEIPLPPLAEQHRIIERVEALLTQVNAAKDRLAKVPLILKRFRQAVLAAACSGAITQDVRGDSEADENELPQGWMWKDVGDLVPKDGLFDGPFGSNLKTADYTSAGIRVIRLENIANLRFIESKRTYISEDKYRALVQHTVREGDIIFGSFLDGEPRVCMLPALPTKAIAKADCFCIRPYPHLVDKEYLAVQLACKTTKDALLQEIHGATRPRITTKQLRKLQVRISPLSEQREIVRRIRTFFSLADIIENRLAAARTSVDKLPQTILSKAFSGQLVPTEAELARVEGRDYEPAGVLLDRIRSEQSSHAVARSRRQQRARS